MHGTKSFCLSLVNGQRWQFVAAESGKQILEDFSALLSLTVSDPNYHPKLIFTCQLPDQTADSGSLPPCDVLAVCGDVPRSGWHSENLGRIWLSMHPEVYDVICHVDPRTSYMPLMPDMWKALLPVYLRTHETASLIVHSALLALEEKGVLLVGPSTIGKSTCARRVPPPWRALCDDEALVVEVRERTYRCHPLPTWSALYATDRCKTWEVEKHIALRAVFFLQQAEVGNMEPVGPGEAAILLNKSLNNMLAPVDCFIPPEERGPLRRAQFDRTCRLAESVPSFMLRVNLTAPFWEMIEQVV